MIDCPNCRRAIDGIACPYCGESFASGRQRPPIPASARAAIDAVKAKARKRPDREAELERAAIQDEAT